MQRIVQTGLLSDEAENRAFAADLEATLAPNHATAGSVEAEIGALVDLHTQSFSLYFGGTNVRPALADLDPHLKKLWLWGFEAVPTLLKHTEDRRLTRIPVHTSGGRLPHPEIVRIGQVVSGLLNGLAGDRAMIGMHWDTQLEGQYVDRAAAEAWWKQASALGEEKYVLQHVLPTENSEQSWPNAHNAVLIASKYPQRLPALYKEAQNRYPRAQNGELAQLLKEKNLFPLP